MAGDTSEPEELGGGQVLFSLSDGVAVVTLNRPDVLNAFSRTMGQGLDEAYRRCDEDDAVRAVVLTGAGRAFCAGADFSDGAAVFGSVEGRSDFRSDPFRFHAWEVRKPVIAAINGHAVGIGLNMTLHCDLRIAAAEAKLGVVQARRGVIADLRTHWTLPRLVGHARAAEIILTGRMFSGQEAASWGLVNEALPADQVLPRAVELASELATYAAPLSVAVSKRLLWRDPPATSDEMDDLETDLHRHLMGSPDSREGVEAFLEKRPPRWSLRVSSDWPEWLDGPSGQV